MKHKLPPQLITPTYKIADREPLLETTVLHNLVKVPNLEGVLKDVPGWTSFRDFQGRTLLHLLVKEKTTEEIKRFFRAIPTIKKLINVQDKNGVTPILLAVREGKMRLVKFLYEQGADPNLVDKEGYSVMFEGATLAPQRFIFIVDKLKKADPNIIPKKEGYTATDAAIYRRAFDLALILKKRKGRITEAGQRFMLLRLQEAIEFNEKESVIKLLKLGVRPTQQELLDLFSWKDNRLNSLILKHVKHIPEGASVYLVSYATLSQVKKLSITPIHLLYVAINPDPKVISYVLEKVSPEYIHHSFEGYPDYCSTPFFAAITADNKKALEIFLEYPVDRETIKNAFDLALKARSQNAIMLLLPYMDKVPKNSLSFVDYTKRGTSKLVKMLIEKGADPAVVYQDELDRYDPRDLSKVNKSAHRMLLRFVS